MRFFFAVAMLAPGTICAGLLAWCAWNATFWVNMETAIPGIVICSNITVLLLFLLQFYCLLYFNRNNNAPVVRRYKSYGYYDVYMFMVLVAILHTTWTGFLVIPGFIRETFSTRLFCHLLFAAIVNNIIQGLMLGTVLCNMVRKIKVG